MSRTLKNGKHEKYSKGSMYGGGNVTNMDKLNLKAKRRKLRKDRVKRQMFKRLGEIEL